MDAVRPTHALLLVFALAPAACSPGAVEAERDPLLAEAARLHHAWVGRGEDGVRVVVEPLRAGPAAELDPAARVREAYGLESDLGVYRVLLRDAEGVRDWRLPLRSGDGVRLGPLELPEDASPRLRLHYEAVAAGVPQDGGRRGYLVAGRLGDADAVLHWERPAAAVELRPRTWTALERRDFLEPGSGGAPAAEPDDE